MKNLIIAFVLVLATIGCAKEPQVGKAPENGSSAMKSAVTLELKRNTASLRWTNSVFKVVGNAGALWSVYECPKVNSAFNPFAPSVCVPVGTYEYTKSGNTLLVTVPGYGVISYFAGASHLNIVPSGGVVYRAILNTSPVTYITIPADAMNLLLNSIPDTGAVRIY